MLREKIGVGGPGGGGGSSGVGYLCKNPEKMG